VGVKSKPTTSGLLAGQVGTVQIVSNKMTFCYACDESQIPSQKSLSISLAPFGHALQLWLDNQLWGQPQTVVELNGFFHLKLVRSIIDLRGGGSEEASCFGH